MAKVELKRVVKAKLPQIKFGAAVWKQIGEIAEGGILDNIMRQRQADGRPIKENAPSTRERKRKEGKPQLSLIDRKKRFIKGGGGSWRFRVLKNGVVIRPAKAELKRISRWVQQKGYVGWFGLSEKHVEVIRAIFRKEIRKQFKGANGRRLAGMAGVGIRK
jgi:hypothetical protein